MQMRPMCQWIALALLLGVPRTAGAFELVAKNDVTADGTPSAPLAIFLAGESATSTLTSPCDGTIVAAQVYWASTTGTAAPQVEQSITFYAAGVHPVPGAILANGVGGDAQISSPTMVDGVMNEFRYLDPPANTLPVGVPVSAGEAFVTSFSFANPSSGGGASTPSVAIDQNGCGFGRNAVELSPAGWLDACLLGTTGDFVIRAVVECSVPPPVPGTGSSGQFLLGVTLTGVGLVGLYVGRRLRDDDF